MDILERSLEYLREIWRRYWADLEEKSGRSLEDRGEILGRSCGYLAKILVRCGGGLGQIFGRSQGQTWIDLGELVQRSCGGVREIRGYFEDISGRS